MAHVSPKGVYSSQRGLVVYLVILTMGSSSMSFSRRSLNRNLPRFVPTEHSRDETPVLPQWGSEGRMECTPRLGREFVSHDTHLDL